METSSLCPKKKVGTLRFSNQIGHFKGETQLLYEALSNIIAKLHPNHQEFKSTRLI